MLTCSQPDILEIPYKSHLLVLQHIIFSITDILSISQNKRRTLFLLYFQWLIIWILI